MKQPKPDLNANSSDDLEQARALSRRLQGGAPRGAPAAEPGYVSFARTPPPVPAVPPVPPVVGPGVRPATAHVSRPSGPLMSRREPLKAPNVGFGPDAWNALLDASVATVAADTALLMDPAGLIIASRGRGGDELEAVGARLMVAFEQADRIDGERSTLSMSIELHRGTLHGVRLAQADGSFLTLGLLIPAGLTGERQARLLTLLAAADAT